MTELFFFIFFFIYFDFAISDVCKYVRMSLVVVVVAFVGIGVYLFG